MKQQTTKINFEAQGLRFKEITVAKNLEGQPAWRTMRGVGQVVRQFMKQTFPKIKFQISTDRFSGGDAVTVYLNPINTTKEEFEQVRESLDAVFSDGKFNSMEDIYEYKPGKAIIHDPVTGIEFNTKYMHVQHKPKYGTKEYEQYEQLQEA